jgi:hypothetical protein
MDSQVLKDPAMVQNTFTFINSLSSKELSIASIFYVDVYVDSYGEPIVWRVGAFNPDRY